MKYKDLEFNLFGVGDSSDINTWSNLPYFFSKSLIEIGIRLNRINIYPQESMIFKSYLRLIKKWIRANQIIGNKNNYDPYRDSITKYFIEKKIKNECRKYNRAKLNIFLTFSFSSYKYSRIPVVHFCDQTYELFLNDTGKEINKRDLHFIDIERYYLENAAHVFATNSRCVQFLKRRYNLKNVAALSSGINLETAFSDKESDIIAAKKQNRDILFIGKGAYKRGVDILIEAFHQFNRANGDTFTLHIVGEVTKDSADAGDDIIYHGYLDKNDPADLKTYHELLKKARLFVMPTRHGPRPGVVKEAGLMYTPVIITNIWHMDELVQDNETGILVDSLDPGAFADRMNYLVKNEEI